MKMREKLNCPNCGAPITAVTCAYCGTRFYDFADIELCKECYIRVRYNGHIITAKFIPYRLSIERDMCSAPAFYGDSVIQVPMLPPDMTFNLEGSVLSGGIEKIKGG